MENNTLVLDFIDDEFELDMESTVDTGGTKNYNQLINKPKLDGVELIGDVKKPEYTAEEVGAVDINDVLSFSDIKEAWDSVFKE